MKLQELKNDELKNVNGGLLGLIGGDNSMLGLVTQGYVGVSHTDEDGQTESTMLNFGLGSIFSSQND